MTESTVKLLVHGVFTSIALIAYAVLTALGKDANALLGFILGQGAGEAAVQVAKRSPAT